MIRLMGSVGIALQNICRFINNLLHELQFNLCERRETETDIDMEWIWDASRLLTF